jgi:aspartyl/glutamyl-tRNA(Asn/Gln) amidotransferase C subunit
MSNTFSIEVVAKLAKLDLSAAEKALYEKQFPGILAYVEQLQKIKLPETPWEDFLDPQIFSRNDQANTWPEEEREAALKQSANYKEGKIKVNKVL